MKTKLIRILYRLTNFLADKTKGFPLFSKWKIALGSLLISLSVISCKQKGNVTPQQPFEPKKDTIDEITCYKQSATSDTIENIISISMEEIAIDGFPSFPISEPSCYIPAFEPIYDTIPALPTFFFEFLQKNIRYPEIDKETGTQGEVYVRFMVSQNGNINRFKILKSPTQSLSKEVVRVLQLMPKLQPCTQYYTLPVLFTFSDTAVNKLLSTLDNVSSTVLQTVVIHGIKPRIPLAVTCYTGEFNPDHTRDTADIMPCFSRKENKLKQYIDKHYKRPINQDTVSGTIVVRVTINKRGKATQPKLLKGIHPDFDQAALDVVNRMPRWKPAKENGKKVKCYITIPFVINKK